MKRVPDVLARRLALGSGLATGRFYGNPSQRIRMMQAAYRLASRRFGVQIVIRTVGDRIYVLPVVGGGPCIERRSEERVPEMRYVRPETRERNLELGDLDAVDELRRHVRELIAKETTESEATA